MFGDDRPQFSEAVWNSAQGEKEKQVNLEEKDIFDFLDAAHQEYGTNCTAYIRFDPSFRGRLSDMDADLQLKVWARLPGLPFVLPSLKPLLPRF